MEDWWRSRWIWLVLPRKRKNAGVWHKGKRYVPCLLKWLTNFFTDAGIRLHHVRSAYQIVRLVWIYRLTVNSVLCWYIGICNAEYFTVKCLTHDLYLIWLLLVTSITTSLFVCGQSAEWATLGLIKLTVCDNQQLSVDIMTTRIVTETKQTVFSYPAYSTTTQTVFKLWWLWCGNATWKREAVPEIQSTESSWKCSQSQNF